MADTPPPQAVGERFRSSYRQKSLSIAYDSISPLVVELHVNDKSCPSNRQQKDVARLVFFSPLLILTF
jgi:hypothetical protein